MRFSNQVQSMQEADIIIGAHGAGLSNIIFARMQTPLIEIFPQFYYMSTFDKLAEVFDITYSSLVAEPDTASFLQCLNHFLKLGRVNNSFIINAKKVWSDRLKIVSQNRTERPALPVWPMPAGYYLRQCARNQQLLVNTTEVKDHVLQGIETICPT